MTVQLIIVKAREHAIEYFEQVDYSCAEYCSSVIVTKKHFPLQFLMVRM